MKNATCTTIAIAALAAVSVYGLGATASAEANLEATANAPAPGVLTVTGTATTTLEAERMIVRFGVESLYFGPLDALRDNSQRMNSVIAALESIGVDSDEISTANFEIRPQYKYDRNIDENVFQGYRVENTVVVNTDRIDEAGLIIEAAVGAGADVVESVSFAASEETKAAARQTLQVAATTNAIQKAETVLNELGQRITGVEYVSINEGGYNQQNYAFVETLSLASVDSFSAAPPISAADQRLSLSVRVDFLIGPQ